MSSALYRKYRPQTFDQMIGQNHIKITLQHELERDEISHAYLFCGPRGLGKTTSARLFAKSVNCKNRVSGESEPCNECDSCLDIMAGRNVDIIEIDAASNTGVDNVRENIIENSRFNPIRSKFKVFIIDEVHMLSTSAFNALLKILEEPPAHVIFILCTTEIHKLPVTIISRCQRFDFKKVTGEQLIKRLKLVAKGENKQIEEEVLKRIVLASDGCVRDAESLLAKVLSLGDEISLEQAEIVLPRTDFENIAGFINYLSEKNSAAAIELINRLINDGFDLTVFVENLMEFLRQMLLVKSSGGLETYGLELAEDVSKSLSNLADKFSWSEILDMIETFSDKGKEIKQSFIPQLPLEIAIIRVTKQVSCQKPDTFVFAVKDPIPTAGKISGSVKASPKVEVINQTSAPVDQKIEASLATSPVVNSAENNKKIEATPNNSVTLEQIISYWPSAVQKLMDSNFSLASLLKISQPIKLDQQFLEIAVSSAFYKGRLEANNNRAIIEAALSEVVGTQIVIKGTVLAQVSPIEMDIQFNDGKAVESPTVESPDLINEVKNAMAVAPKLDVTEEVLSMF